MASFAAASREIRLTAGRSVARPTAFTSGRRRIVVNASTALPDQFKAVNPVGDRVFVKVDKEETRTVGGLVLPSTAAKKPTAGTVIGVGDVQMVKLGDKVVYSKYAGTELTIKGDLHVLLKEEDVIGVLPSNDKISELKPLSDRVLIKSAKAEDKTAGGVLLTSDSAEKPTFGTVVAVGEGKKKEDSDEVVPPNVKTGSTVMYSKYSGTEFEDTDDTQYIVVRESDILAALQ